MQASDSTPPPQPSRRHWPDRTAHRHRRLARKAFVVVAALLVVLPWLGYRELRSAMAEQAGTPAASLPPSAPQAPPPAVPAVTPSPQATVAQPSAKSEGTADAQAQAVPVPERPSLAGPGHALEREIARADVQRIAGVRAAGWLDRERLLVVVEGNHLRTDATISTVCARLAATAGTAGVLVQLQDAAATTPPELRLLGRRCSNAPGDPSQLVAQPVDDGLDALRAQVERDSATADADQARRDRNAESMRILETSTPQF